MQNRKLSLGQRIAVIGSQAMNGIGAGYQQPTGGGWDYSVFEDMGRGIGDVVADKRRRNEEEERKRRLLEAKFGTLNLGYGIGKPMPAMPPASAGNSLGQLFPYSIGRLPSPYVGNSGFAPGQGLQLDQRWRGR